MAQNSVEEAADIVRDGLGEVRRTDLQEDREEDRQTDPVELHEVVLQIDPGEVLVVRRIRRIVAVGREEVQAAHRSHLAGAALEEVRTHSLAVGLRT